MDQHGEEHLKKNYRQLELHYNMEELRSKIRLIRNYYSAAQKVKKVQQWVFETEHDFLVSMYLKCNFFSVYRM